MNLLHEAPLRLGAREVHVWSLNLESDPDALEPLLSYDEIERAERFRFERDRRRYITGRGLTRTVLARYLGRDPASLAFRYGPYGRPELAEMPFNVSHSGDLAVVAVGLQQDIGVDIERLRPEPAEEEVAERFFSPTEVNALRSLPRADQPRAFLSCWTRKEAFIKALGNGLSLALHSFDVTLRPGEPPALIRTAWSASEPRRWSLLDLSASFPGHVAALAVRRRDVRVLVRDWNDRPQD
jgi:4'-phosphopantetheinyl transferase